MFMRHSLHGLLIALALASLGPGLRPALAGPEVHTTGGIAIHGADPVAYFTTGRAVAGVPAYALMWAGATWYFASAEHMAAFEANPRAYAPQFGGYCAHAAAQGGLLAARPEIFIIHEGKLYLAATQDALDQWRADAPGHIAAAKRNWRDLIDD